MAMVTRASCPLSHGRRQFSPNMRYRQRESTETEPKIIQLSSHWNLFCCTNNNDDTPLLKGWWDEKYPPQRNLTPTPVNSNRA